MNKYTKVGLSALCGSLASIAAANAGTLDVTGTAEATWTNKSGLTTGNPIGMNTGLTFTGNGELDGGQTFSVAITQTDKATWSSSNISLVTNSIGTFKLSSAEGSGGLGGYDDNMPTAWEEVWDTGVSTNANFQKGVGSSTNISWTSPEALGSKLIIAYAPDNDGAQNANKAASGSASDEFGMGYDVVLDIDMQGENSGVNLILGGSKTKQAQKRNKVAGAEIPDLEDDHDELMVGLVISIGPVELGGQISAERLGTKALNSVEYYGNSSWGLAFNVNDDLSLSYSEARHVQTKTHKANNPSQVIGFTGHQMNEYTPKAWMRGSSIQVAYTIGGVALKYAQTEYDDTGYTYDGASPLDARIVAVSLAF
jgi:hypothetical protein